METPTPLKIQHKKKKTLCQVERWWRQRAKSSPPASKHPERGSVFVASTLQASIQSVLWKTHWITVVLRKPRQHKQTVAMPEHNKSFPPTVCCWLAEEKDVTGKVSDFSWKILSATTGHWANVRWKTHQCISVLSISCRSSMWHPSKSKCPSSGQSFSRRLYWEEGVIEIRHKSSPTNINRNFSIDSATFVAPSFSSCLLLLAVETTWTEMFSCRFLAMKHHV